ncbi:MAG: heavy-metal-associated domain-containing protein [Candidatus Aenigmarchaeota archaeon]|nr:heavy-metal-associated domain-containing protein [Candidatus Aenigmarchaeota archaeon]
MKKMLLNVKGMHCNSCEQLIAMALDDLGIKGAKADHKTGAVSFSFDPAKVDMEKIKAAIRDEGYEV